MRKFKQNPNRSYEWPVTMMWYTKKAGKTIEEIIDSDVDFFIWMVETFQNVTPKQAEYFKRKYKVEVPSQFIQNVEPYEWKEGDPELLYTEICKSQDLQSSIKKYRGIQLSLF